MFRCYHILLSLVIVPCLDAGLENVQTLTAMEMNGWTTDINNGDTAYNNWIYSSLCGDSTFWGYNYLWPIGSVSAVFKGSGKARLNFGACSLYGTTKVYLNNRQIGIAQKRKLDVVTNFQYKKGDILKLEEEGMGIIKINSLKLACTGN